MMVVHVLTQMRECVLLLGSHGPGIVHSRCLVTLQPPHVAFSRDTRGHTVGGVSPAVCVCVGGGSVEEDDGIQLAMADKVQPHAPYKH